MAGQGRSVTAQKKASGSSLAKRLERLSSSPPREWRETGSGARPNLHGLLRYPAMMVPRMQGDIIDAVLDHTGTDCRLVDPFVGSGTMLTESSIRGLDFVGIDINPLAVLVCEAKAAIGNGADVEQAAATVLNYIRKDVDETIDVDFPNRAKWFSDEAALSFSKLRRAICQVGGDGARKVMWTVFAETVRLCSNSRTSTYKLHIRKPDDVVSAYRIEETFIANLRQALSRTREFAPLVASATRRPRVRLICGDVRKAVVPNTRRSHQIIVTSPPYGDNQTTIPYGQFSYLALRWIPPEDLPHGFVKEYLSNTHALDSASLGGTSREAEHKADAMRLVSSAFDAYYRSASSCSDTSARKVAGFAYDFLEACSQLRARCASPSHWIVTTGNRTAGGTRVPFDAICRDIVQFLGGTPVSVLQRELPNKRMPSRNSLGEMITSETTLVAEFQ